MKIKRKLPLIDKILLWINCGLCLALLISYLAPTTDPNKNWVIAFFGLAYPPLLFTNGLMIIWWLFRKKTFALISVIGILCGWNVLRNNIGVHPGNSGNDKPAGENVVRIMTYNVHNFKKYGSNKDISTKHEILDLIKNAHPDILGVQEYYTRNRGQYDMTDSIQKMVGVPHYYFEEFDRDNSEAIGMAVFSKYPIINKGLIRLSTTPGSSNQCLYIDIKINGHPLRIYSVHLQSISFDPQDYKYLKGGKANIYSTKHVLTKLKSAFLRRSEQVFKVKEHAKNCPYPYSISGDFNDTPSSFAVNQMAKGLKNAFREKGFGLGRTYNGDFPNYQIDYIMASPQLNVASYTIIEKKLSDHFPVCVDLILSPPTP